VFTYLIIPHTKYDHLCVGYPVGNLSAHLFQVQLQPCIVPITFAQSVRPSVCMKQLKKFAIKNFMKIFKHFQF
jgi:hypothetical protein